MNTIRAATVLLAAMTAVATTTSPAIATVAISLNVAPTQISAPDGGGWWWLVAKTDDPDGISAIRALLEDVDDGAIADGDWSDDIRIAGDIGAIDPIVTSGGPRPPYLDLAGGGTELLYGQDLSSPGGVVTGAGTAVTSDGPDLFGDPAWDDSTLIAWGTYPSDVPSFLAVEANVLTGSSPPFLGSQETTTSIVRLPEPALDVGLLLGTLALVAAQARRRTRSRRTRGVGLVVAVVVALGASQLAPLRVAASEWIGPSGQPAAWNDPSNWSAGVPSSGTNATFDATTSPAIVFLPAQAMTASLEVEGTVELRGPGALQVVGDVSVGPTVDGWLEIADFVVVTADGQVTLGSGASVGTMWLGGGSLDNSGGGGIVVVSGTLEGTGMIDGNVIVSNAAVAPGGPIGTLSVHGTYVQETAAVFEVEVGGAGPEQFDKIDVSSFVSLAGFLELHLLYFAPAPTDTFEIVSAGTLVGEFGNVADGARLNLSSGGTGSFQVDYNSTTVVLSDFQGTADLFPPGDFNFDGVVDAQDFLIWQRGGSPSGLTSVDLDAWKDNYGFAVP